VQGDYNGACCAGEQDLVGRILLLVLIFILILMDPSVANRKQDPSVANRKQDPSVANRKQDPSVENRNVSNDS
jgi:hypothetical protein